jgi:RNA polymerase sigma-54 factor
LVEFNVLQASTLELNQMIGQELSEISRLDDECRDYYQQSRSNRMRSDEENERIQRRMDSLVEAQTLTEHLTEQLNTTDCEKEIYELTEMLIGYIDDDGFLSQNIEDLALENAIPFQSLKKSLSILQSFHPPGIGAQDLRECLLIQLNILGKNHSLEYRIVDKHLDELARKRHPQTQSYLNYRRKKNS